MMMQQMNINSSAPITTSAGILNLDHYKYLRSLLPSVPHFIESLSFTDLNNWECQIYVALLTESDCMKWLTDFQETTKTDWKVDKDASRQVAQTNKLKAHWMMVYRCIPSDSKKECTAKLEMKILGQGENERMNKHGKQYPCLITVHFYHNHMATSSTVVSMESFKSQDIPSHLKEGFEGYFQETMQPTNNMGQPTTVNLNAIKPQHSLHQSPISHSVSNAHVVIKTEPIISPIGQHQHMHGKLERTNHEIFDLADVSRKLDMTLDVLRVMLKQTGTACASVKQFVDKFERLKGDQTQLEDALTSFGGQWDWLVQGANDASPQQPPLSPASVGSVESPKKKSKKKKKPDSPQQVFSTNIVGGQIVLQPQPPCEPPDAKRRKRARCGSCSGCLNRDKTQDCRQCRNCMDQKRYGGPGRLKKACIKRQCVVISQMIAAELAGGDRKSPATPHLVKTEGVAAVLATQQPLPVSHGLATPQHVPVTHHVTMVTSQAGATSRVQQSATTTIPASTLLSWPGTHYAQTFQVQQPVQFAFQPQAYPGAPAQIQYATSQIQHLGTSQLETIASEAARHHGVG